MLTIQSLSVSYGSQPVLQEVSLSVKPGEVFALIGPNGAGKTTLLRAISGVIRPLAGKVQAFGKDLIQLPATQRARFLAVVPQARKLPPAYTVWQTVLLGRTPHLGWLGQPSQRDLQRTQWALERTQTIDLAGRCVDQLSGGEQQLVLLARALAQDTPILLLDEPTAHLDLHHQSNLLSLVRRLAKEQGLQSNLLSLVRRLAKEQGLAVLMALHDLNLVALYSDQVALLVNGHLRASGNPGEVLTPQQLVEAYRVPLQVIAHPSYGTPLVLLNGHNREEL